ncbi:MAG: rhodanese-like domain-containing protein [Bacteroidota bacterium]
MKRVYGMLLIMAIAACSGKEEKTLGKIEVLEKPGFSKVITEDILLVDVRTAKEYEAGFIPGAVNVDFKQNDFEKRMSYFDRETPIALYCSKGGRSSKAAKKLHKMGFSKVYDLKGGYNQWVLTE